MPWASPIFALPAPCPGETVDDASFAILANAIDAQMALLDAKAALALKRPYAQSTVTGSVAVGVATTLTFSSGSTNDNMFGVLPATVMTVNTPGVYLASFTGTHNTFTTVTSAKWIIRQNGADRFAYKQYETTAGRQTSFTGPLICAAGDTLAVQLLWTGTGGPTSVANGKVSFDLICKAF